ncbi:MAG: flavodoxin family protein [Desulfobacterales bacterium]|jgi:multimeric flavodoxin WrbA|nr:flavodoxin family protein [Desulfobacterales bacterium]
MPRKILVVIGSPRKNGNSASLARQVAAGARESGAKVETVFLQGMRIEPCTACDACRKKLKKDCIIKDDMRALYPRIKAADGIVIASPIYWFTVSAQTKLFMDRWYALGGDGGYDLASKKFGVVLAYADADPFASGAVNALRTFQDAFHYLGAELVGTVYGSAWKAGEIRKNKDLMDAAYTLGKKIAGA